MSARGSSLSAVLGPWCGCESVTISVALVSHCQHDILFYHSSRMSLNILSLMFAVTIQAQRQTSRDVIDEETG